MIFNSSICSIYDSFQVSMETILNEDIVILIVNAYLSNFTWNKLMYHTITDNRGNFLNDFLNLVILKRVSKSVYDELTNWDYNKWQLLEYPRDTIIKDINYRTDQYSLDNTRIVWADDPYDGDFEFWYDITYKLSGKNIEIEYEGYKYSCPFIKCCIKGSALIDENDRVVDDSIVVFKTTSSGIFPGIGDVLQLLALPIVTDLCTPNLNELYPEIKVEVYQHSRYFR